MTPEMQKKIDKLYLEINTAENALGRALYALKALKTEVMSHTCDHHHEEPAPTPAPTPTPAPAPTPTPAPAPHDPNDGHTHPTPAPSPTPTPTSSGYVLAKDVPVIPSNFDKSLFSGPAGLPETGYPDVLGAFRFDFNVSHYSYNDPIVYPGKAGAAHLHEFWGNTSTDHNSTYESLRKNGRGTTTGDALNRSAYWAPPLMVGDTILVPDHGTAYYKRLAKAELLTPDHFAETIGVRMPEPKRSQFLATYAPGLSGYDAYKYISEKAIALVKKHTPDGGAILTEIPRGLKVLSKGGEFTLRKSAANGGGTYSVKAEDIKAAHETGVGMTLAQMMAKAQPGDTLHHTLWLPDLWDGVNVDTPDHMSHFSKFNRDNNTARYSVTDTHKHIITKVTMFRNYKIVAGLDYTKLALSSDIQMGAYPGSTSHWDYWEAWDEEMRLAAHQGSIDQLLNTSGGNMGNGTGLKRHFNFSFDLNVNTLPLNVVPKDGGSYYVKPVPSI